MMRISIYTLAVSALLSSCWSGETSSFAMVKNNDELKAMVVKDQAMRSSAKDVDLEATDKVHRDRVFELLAAGCIQTNEDKLNAALILQHTALIYCNDKLKSVSPENYLLAYQLSKSAFEAGDERAAYFVATTYDRYLLYTQGYQKYGTQRIFDEQTGAEMWAPIDPVTTDAERRMYSVPAFDSLLRQYTMQPFKPQGS